jgi:hypothetical protein
MGLFDVKNKGLKILLLNIICNFGLYAGADVSDM